MSDTPETNAAVKESDGQWSNALKETCQRLERERDEWARLCSQYKQERDELLKKLKSSEQECFKRGKDIEMLELALKAVREERDEAREKANQQRKEIVRLNGATSHADGTALSVALRERDEAKKKNEDYFHWVNELVNERDELKKIVEQRILVGAEIHDKANSLIKQSNRTEAECEALRKQLYSATSALRQIHLEVGDWIRSTIIVEE